MTLVVDASVALKWYVDEPGSAEAASLLTSDERLIAPQILVAEVCNAAVRLFRRGYISAVHAEQISDSIGRHFGRRLESLAPLAHRAAGLAIELGHSSYDCFYLALAEREAAVLITADDAFLGKLGGSLYTSHARPLVAAG